MNSVNTNTFLYELKTDTSQDNEMFRHIKMHFVIPSFKKEKQKRKSQTEQN